jgi:hypothetical protein
MVKEDELTNTEKEAKMRYDSLKNNLHEKYHRCEWGVRDKTKTAKFGNEILKEFCGWRNNLGKQ